MRTRKKALLEARTIGQRLRETRQARGLSQRALAEPGVSYAYISRIEAGTRNPSVKALRRLAQKLSVSVEWLETGVEPNRWDAFNLAELSLIRSGLERVNGAAELDEEIRAVLRDVKQRA